MEIFILGWLSAAILSLSLFALMLRKILSISRITKALESIAQSQARMVQIEKERNVRIAQSRRVA